MIVSPETFYNLSALLHIAMLVFVAVLIVSHVIISVAKFRALRDLKSVKAKMEAMIEDPHDHMANHAHEAGEAIEKGDLVTFRDGLLMKANEPSHFTGFSRPIGVVEMREQAKQDLAKKLGIVLEKRKRPVAKKAVKKVAKKTTKKK